MTDEVLIEVDGNIGRIRLNRPKAIHALTQPMVDAMTRALADWREDEEIVAVLLDHADGRGFCAGGDIRLLADSAKADGSAAEKFWFDEYRLNHLMFSYGKPIIAFIDGIVMGGGVGISLPARYRVATERTTFAMPETGIGLFPDVGGGWFLPRLPGRTGAWLAATGSRINGADCAAIGIATHYIPSDALDGVKAQILADHANLDAILKAASTTPPEAPINALRADIDRLFASDRLEDILAALEADGGDWAMAQRATIGTKSPQTVKVALRQLAQGAKMASFADNMRMEYALACQVLRRPDFVEGVRAVIVDKDNAPKWDPATPEAVSDALIDSLFAPLPADKAWTPLPLPEKGA